MFKVIVLTSLLPWLLGSWTCHGKLSNGKSLDAHIEITGLQNGQSVLFRQDDVAPGNYHATGMWTMDGSSKKLVALLQDNSGGARYFVSPEAIAAGADTVTLVDTAILGHQPFAERFVYSRPAPGRLRVDWEVQALDQSWRLGDRNDCVPYRGEQGSPGGS